MKSSECKQCGEHAMECACARNNGEMAIIIIEAIFNSDPKLMKFAPDALIRSYVYLAKNNEWSLGKILREADQAIPYYYNSGP